MFAYEYVITLRTTFAVRNSNKSVFYYDKLFCELKRNYNK